MALNMRYFIFIMFMALDKVVVEEKMATVIGIFEDHYQKKKLYL